jgi:hypothetical protein
LPIQKDSHVKNALTNILLHITLFLVFYYQIEISSLKIKKKYIGSDRSLKANVVLLGFIIVFDNGSVFYKAISSYLGSTEITSDYRNDVR